uniref:Uncharacterized protein n=1 Tax=Heterorhabditis bacteriophora TaxID=37862 RepID=A0A1I7WCW0_HETBA
MGHLRPEKDQCVRAPIGLARGWIPRPVDRAVLRGVGVVPGSAPGDGALLHEVEHSLGGGLDEIGILGHGWLPQIFFNLLRLSTGGCG